MSESTTDTEDELFRVMDKTLGARSKTTVGFTHNDTRRVLTVGKINVRIVKGLISEEQTDVIVNSSNKNLDLSKGRASKALLEAASKSLQSECNSKYPSGIDYGDVAVTGPGDLDCKKVFHGALPKWEGPKQEKVLKEFVINILEECTKRKMKSLAMPALGTGYLSYPADKTAAIVFGCIDEFDGDNDDTSLKDIKIVVFGEDKGTYDAFVAKARQRSLGQRKDRLRSAPPSRQPATNLVNRTSCTSNIGNIQVKVIVGSMAEQIVDVIVNSSSPNLKLDNRPGLSQSLLEVAGQSLQDDCDENYPNGIKPGEVAITDGYNLKCQKVFHGTLPGWYSKRSESLLPEKVMSNFVTKCLEKAERNSFKTIAFPALGTGFLKYPVDITVTKMIKTIGKFEHDRKSNSISEVRIVIYPGSKDWTEIEKEFIDQLSDHKPTGKPTVQPVLAKKIPARGTKEFLEFKYREDLKTPSYWTEFHSGKSIKDWNTRRKGPPFKFVDVDQKTCNYIVGIFKATWGGNTGPVTPAFGLHGFSLQPSGSGHVIKVQRIENIYLFERYQQECQRLFRKAATEGGIQPVEKTKGSSGAVVTTKQMDKSLTSHLYPEINEHYFFHGTKVNRVDVIVSQGLDCRLAMSGRVGCGVYGAERSSKSAAYVDQNSNGESKMFLIRMCLGDVCVSKNNVSYKRPPCKKCGKEICFTHVECYDSVMADGGAFADREFVVYDRYQSYPEYLITYK